jgi:hypothetical protein
MTPGFDGAIETGRSDEAQGAGRTPDRDRQEDPGDRPPLAAAGPETAPDTSEPAAPPAQVTAPDMAAPGRGSEHRPAPATAEPPAAEKPANPRRGWWQRLLEP